MAPSWGGGNPTPCIDDEHVYAISKGEGQRTDLACWDKVTGELKWKGLVVCRGSSTDGSGDTRSPMVYGDLLFASDGLFDKRSGNRLGDSYCKFEENDQLKSVHGRAVVRCYRLL